MEQWSYSDTWEAQRRQKLANFVQFGAVLWSVWPCFIQQWIEPGANLESFQYQAQRVEEPSVARKIQNIDGEVQSLIQLSNNIFFWFLETLWLFFELDAIMK